MKKDSSAILRCTQLQKLLALSKTTIYARLDPKSAQHDPNFPRPFKLNPASKNAGAVGWLESECQEYVARLVAVSRTPA